MGRMRLGWCKFIREKGAEMQEDNDEDVREPARTSQEKAFAVPKNDWPEVPC